MNALIAAELRKLTSIRAPRWIVVGQVVLLAMAASGAVVSGGITAERLATPDGLRLLLEHGGVVAIFSLALGITLSAGEFRHGTVVDTYLTEPRRDRVIAAKLAAAAATGALIGAVVAVTVLVIGLAWCRAKDVAFDWSVGWRSAVGVACWQLLYTMAGVALGAMVRAQAVAITIAVGWLFVAEPALGQLLDPVARWLPATAAQALGNGPGAGLLPQAGGGLVLAGWTVAAGLGAVAVTRRRDLA